jgi:hypothetical protein
MGAGAVASRGSSRMQNFAPHLGFDIEQIQILSCLIKISK